MPEAWTPRHAAASGRLRPMLAAWLGAEGSSPSIDALLTRLQWLQIAGGQTLMQQGEPGDAMYFVVSGRLRAFVDDGRGSAQPVGDVLRGETVGEAALLAGGMRRATVVAVRDCVLVRLQRADFDALVAQHPALALALGRQVLARHASAPSLPSPRRPGTMAMLPIGDGVDAVDFAQRLAAALRPYGRTRVVTGLPTAGDDAAAEAAVAMQLDELEAGHDFVLLVGRTADDAWTRCCTRHADEILLLADATRAPARHPLETDGPARRIGLARPDEVLVLLHPAGARSPRGTQAWLARRPVADHVHVRPALARDMARLARLQSRNAVGVVFAGGGARGLAHLGVYRALREHGVEIDCVGGTSIGAVVATYVASDQPPEVVEANARRAFASRPTGDVDWLPLLSLYKGRRLRSTLAHAVRDLVGFDADVEDLWKSHFSVATNFTQAREQVLRQGNLVRALLASCSIPGALPPVVHGGELLCDGGTFNNLPVDVMRRMRGVGRVIAVDIDRPEPARLGTDELPGRWALLLDRLRPRGARRLRLPWLPSYLRQMTTLYSRSRRLQARAQADLCLAPAAVPAVGLMDWHQLDRVVDAAYRETCRELAALEMPTVQWLAAAGVNPSAETPTSPASRTITASPREDLSIGGGLLERIAG